MIRVLLADDHDGFRQALVSLIEDTADIEVCGEAADGLEAVAAALETHPDVVLMDLAMPALDGLTATREIVRAIESARIIVLTSRAGAATRREASDAGALGFLAKGCAPTDLLDAVRAATGGAGLPLSGSPA
jgi:DNA-binding NarL/FixJ family response regulator